MSVGNHMDGEDMANVVAITCSMSWAPHEQCNGHHRFHVMGTTWQMSWAPHNLCGHVRDTPSLALSLSLTLTPNNTSFRIWKLGIGNFSCKYLVSLRHVGDRPSYQYGTWCVFGRAAITERRRRENVGAEKLRLPKHEIG